MEVRTSIRGSGISKSFVAVAAVVATMGLGVTAGVVAKNLSAPAGVPAHVLQGQGGYLQYSGHRGGAQVIDETLAPAYQQVDTRGVTAGAAAVGPDDRATTSHLGSLSTLQVDTRGIIPVEAFGSATMASSQLAPNSFLGPDAQDRNSQLAGSAANSFLGPDAQERNAALAAAARTAKPHGYI